MELNKVTLLQSYFDFFYAKEICERIHSVFKKRCYGCQHSCLSQTNHTCLTLSNKQLLELYFDDVLSVIDECDILMRWEASVSGLDVSPELFEMYKLKMYCKDWRETDMKTSKWKTKMINMTVQLLKLGNRFN